MIGAVLAWLRGRPLLAHGVFALALLGKEQAAVVPLVFLCADLLGLTGPARRRPREWVLRYAPAVVLLVLYGALRASLFGGSEFRPGTPLGPLWSYGYALQVLVAPTRALVYEPELTVWPSLPRLLAASAAVLGLGLAAWRAGAARAPLAFWIAWFALLQLPTANLLEQEAPFDERYVFLASLGLWALPATLVSRRWTDPRLQIATLFCGALAAGMAGGLSAGRAQYFANDEAFVTQWQRSSPDSLDANVHLGRVRLNQRRFEASARLYARALEINPGSAAAQLGAGRVLQETGRVAEAQAAYARAVGLDPRDAYARFYLAVMLEREGANDAALRSYREALRLKPNLAEGHFNLANLLKQGGDADAAVEAYTLALHYNPAFPSAHFNLANTLAQQERFEEAIVHYRAAKAIDPGGLTLRNNLALALAHAGRVEESERELRAALELDPDDVMTQRNLQWLTRRRESR
jgi:tetratricopeptide (TPR) repeat protein